jgi:glycine oxidase
MTGITRNSDCIVVGGGLLGMLTARALCKEGLSVTILERGEAGREASWAGGGILSPLIPWQYPDSVAELVVWSQHYYPQLVEELLAQTGIDAEWVQSGLLILSTMLDSGVSEWAERFKCRIQSVSPAQVRQLEPKVVQAAGDSLLLPDVAQIRNPLLCTALSRSIRMQGVELHEHTEVTGLTVQSGRVLGVKEARPGLLCHITLYGGHYLIPRQNGLVLAGSTLEYTGYNKETTEEARETLTEKALDLMPALSGYPVIKHWAGLRPGTATSVPYIGEHPQIHGLFVNTGHFRNGVVMAPASAQLLADCMLGRDSFTPFEAYSL